jgi:type II secretory pathway component PulF
MPFLTDILSYFVILVPLAVVLVGFTFLWITHWARRWQVGAEDSTALRVFNLLSWIGIVAGILLYVYLAGSIYFLLLAAIILCVALIAGFVRGRRNEVKYLLWNLAEAARREIPLETVARAFAHEQHGRLAKRSHNLADYMDAAMPLSLALSRSKLAVAPEVRMAADVGEKTGTLSQSLTKVLQQSTDADRLLGSLLARIVYISVIFCILVLTLTFMMLKIVPTFAEMFSEFGLQLPMATQLLISCSRICAEYWYLLAPIVLFVGLVTVLLVLSYIGIPVRGLPGVEWFYAATERAAVLQQLAVSVREKQSFVTTLELMSAYSLSRRTRNRLHKAIRQIADGRPWYEALHKTRIVTRAQAGLLYSAEQAGNLGWALEEMADSTLRHSAYRIQATVNLVFPFAVLGCGLCVAFFAAGMLLPVFNLISSLA